jgi:hypothetical protein
MTTSSTFRLESTQRGAQGFEAIASTPDGHDPIYVYDRMGEPNNDMLAKALALAEGGECAVTFATGMAAVHAAITCLLQEKSEVIAHRTLYGCTYSLLTNWMPRFEPLSTIQVLHRIQSDVFKYHYQNIHYIAGVLMRRLQPLPPYIAWLQSLADPYAQMNRAEIRAIPYAHISPTSLHILRRNIINDYHQRNTVAGEVIDAAVAATVAAAAAQPPAVDYDDYISSMFDAAAGYVAPAEEPVLPASPDFILENHLAHEVQKGTECPITFEALSSLAEVAMSRDCGHFFEPEALKAWGKVQQNEGKPIVCPVCRKQFSEVVTMTNNYYIQPAAV